MPVRKGFTEILQRAQPRLPRSGRLEVRVTAAEAALFKAAAGLRHLTVSEWLRTVGREGATRDLQIRQRSSKKKRS